MNSELDRLHGLDQSTWLDYISRDLRLSGRLREIVRQGWISGVTSNPTIFRRAIVGSAQYDAALAEQARRGASVYEAYLNIAGADIRDTADTLDPFTSARKRPMASCRSRRSPAPASRWPRKRKECSRMLVGRM
jgi:hypothetical protein